MRTLYTAILFQFFYITLSGQAIIRGVVTNIQDGLPVVGANVMLQELGGNSIVAFTQTNPKGEYAVKSKAGGDSVTVVVTGFNIGKQGKTIVCHSQTLDFKVMTQAISLNEIKVKPVKIREHGDTLDYMVSGYTEKNDRTIANVLKRMPGIDVTESGKIYYQGKPINRFYIENLDMLQGRYGLATNNISAKDVATVQVMENHQPVKTLKNKVFTENAAINLKLTDAAKGTFSLNGQIGAGGQPLLWNNELISMYFSKTRQNMNTYKGNNSGDDVLRDFGIQYSDDGSSLSNRGFLSVQQAAEPGIGSKRFLRNNMHAASTNNLWKLGKDYQLSTNLLYSNDRRENFSFMRTSYFLPNDSLLAIEETMSHMAWLNMGEVEVRLNANTNRYYLNNQIKLKGAWNRDAGEVLAVDTILQQLKKPEYQLDNSLHLVRNWGKHILNFYSFNGYAFSPHQLGVMSVLVSSLFSGTDLVSTRQQCDLGNFVSRTRVSYGINKWGVQMDNELGVNVNLQHLQSALQVQTGKGEEQTADSLGNQLYWNKYDFFGSTAFTITKQKWSINLFMPVTQTLLTIDDRLLGRVQQHQLLFFNPYTQLNFTICHGLRINLNAGLYNSLGDLNNHYSGYIMQSYRNITRTDGRLLKQASSRVNATIKYKDPVNLLFSYLEGGYWQTRSNLLFGSRFVGVVSIQTTMDVPAYSEGASLTAGISKGIDLLSSTLKLDCRYSQSRSDILVQEKIIQVDNESYGLNANLATRLTSWTNMTYQVNTLWSKNRIVAADNNLQPIHNVRQQLSLSAHPWSNFTVTLNWEYFYNNSITFGSRNMSFSDIHINYRHKKTEWSLEYMNIFNTQEYVSASYNEVSSYYYSYRLLPVFVLAKVRFKIL